MHSKMTQDIKTTKIMTTMTSRKLTALLSLHIIMIVWLVLLDKNILLLNIELSFGVAVLIIFSSYQGYKKMINYSVDNDVRLEIKDPLDAIEDPYDLYDDENEEDLDVKELKKQMKKDGLKKMVKTSAGHISWKRMVSYAFLVFTFLALKNNDALHIGGYLTGLTLGIITATFLGPKLIKE